MQALKKKNKVIHIEILSVQGSPEQLVRCLTTNHEVWGSSPGLVES